MRPLLEAPITGAATTFRTPEQTVLAAWAVKTALVFQASQTDEPMAPPAHYLHLREHQAPPRQVAIWLGSHYRARYDATNSVFLQRPLSLESLDGHIDPVQLQGSAFGYLNFIAVGGVSFLIVGHGYPNVIDLEYEGHLADALIRIWPPRSPVISWPPEYMMDRDLVDTITLAPSGFTATVLPA